jgi:hypothetical protein
VSHEHERLSAYLDGELPAGERAEVEAHLATCAACAARLASLAAVDAAFASLPAEAPDGYFESLPSRVSTRLREEPRRPPRRLPVWAWAAAAVLVLSVVTPLTLRRSGVPPTPAGAPAIESRPARDEGSAGPGPTPAAPAPAPAPAAARAATTKAPAAAAPAPPPVRETADAPGNEPKLKPAPEEARAQKAVGPADLLGGTRPAAVPEEQAAVADRFRAATAESLAPSGPAASVRAYEAQAVENDEAAFRRLQATRPRSAAEWRALRDAWRHFAASRPGSPRADEARVREVEALYEAWRAGGEAPDEEAFRSAARDYLARPDAAQRARVERLLP